jgi:hypothetical protein
VLFSPPVHLPLLGRRLGGLTASAALHAAVVLSATGLAPQAAGGSQEPAEGPVVVAVAADVVTSVPAAEQRADDVEARPALEIAGVAVDLDKILARRDALFPFLTLGAPLWNPPAMPREQRPAPLRNPLAAGARGSTRPPLRLSDRALQALVDRAWSRRERWRPFAPIAALIEAHDADQGRAADLVQGYSDQNLLQPYYDSTTRDARFWAMLGLAADHIAFIELVGRFTKENPASRVSTELLFLLDELVQGSRDTLLMLTSTDPHAALRLTASEQPEAYELALSLRAHYAGWLRTRQLDSDAAIKAKYDDVRLHLLSAIVEQSPNGYRVSDARYLAGVIAFEQNNLAGAEHWWRQMRPADGDSYAAASREIIEAMRLPGDSRVAAIVAVLGAEHRRWLDFSEQRLRQFGHSFDRF